MNEASNRPVIRRLCVYCGSGTGIDPIYAEAAHGFGRILAEEGIGLVYGGGSIGLMGEIARSVLQHGGYVIGVIPNFLKRREHMLIDAQELLVVEDMHQRKQQMFLRSDAFVALPGGLGTLEELVEQLTWSQLGQHRKPIVLANINGFWDLLLELLDHMRNEAYIPPDSEPNLVVVERIEDIVPAVARALPAVQPGKEEELGPEARVTVKF